MRASPLLALFLCLFPLGCSPYARIATLRQEPAPARAETAQEMLDACARAHFPSGMPATATVSIRGEWSKIANALQPELCDRHWRGPSRQTYDLAAGTTRQHYDNPQGAKEVFWDRRNKTLTVTRAGAPDDSEATRDCAALVAEAYPYFLAGAGLMKERAIHPVCVGEAKAEPDNGPAEMCDLVAVELKPGFGFSDGDEAVLWIGRQTRRLHKMQMTLRGFEPTRTAEVTVSFFAWQRDDNGCLWPARSEEYLYRPAPLSVYVWETSVLETTPRQP